MRANKEVNGVPRFRKLNCQQGKKQDETAVKKRGNIYLGLVTVVNEDRIGFSTIQACTVKKDKYISEATGESTDEKPSCS